MLERLLELVQRGESLSLGELAKQLGTSEALVAQMLATLERMGYVKQLENCPAAACSDCQLAASCASRADKGAPRVWTAREHQKSRPEG